MAKNKICPVMSYRDDRTTICSEKCAWYITINNEEGAEVGVCAVAMSALSQYSDNLKIIED